MTKKIYLLVFSVLGFLMSYCQPICDVEGDWKILKGRFFENYEEANPYSVNYVQFSENTIVLSSGFFYNTMSIEDEYPVGRYPYVYYGSKEKYKILDDSLFVYSSPYNNWSAFKLNCIDQDHFVLIGKTDTISGVRHKLYSSAVKFPIKFIKAQVESGSNSLYQVEYKVTFNSNDEMIYEQQDTSNTGLTLKKIKLRAGTFENLCKGFNNVDITNLNSLYGATESHFGTVRLEIGLKDGSIIKSTIQGSVYPDELRLALIPILYLHQQFVYPKLRPVRMNK